VPGSGGSLQAHAACFPAANLDRRGATDMTQVIVDKNEPFEAALKRFNKKVQEDRILSEVRRRRFFEKPSVERKKKKAAKKRKSRKETLRNEERE
jgi:small subunit ribosomal protein S21